MNGEYLLQQGFPYFSWADKSHPFDLIDSSSLGTISLFIGLQMSLYFLQRMVTSLTSLSGEVEDIAYHS